MYKVRDAGNVPDQRIDLEYMYISPWHGNRHHTVQPVVAKVCEYRTDQIYSAISQ